MTPARKPTPTVSRACDDGTLVELLYDPRKRTTALAVRDARGKTSIQPSFTLPNGERLVPYSPSNGLIASGCVKLPSDIREFGDLRDLLAALADVIQQHVSLSPAIAAIAPYYVLLTWVYDAFGELPYLRFRGDWGTGKTRALMVIGSLCYKPFFASGASTVSPIFHILDTFGGTLVLDEADLRFSDATAELSKILNNGTVAGIPVLRTITTKDGELTPRAFRVFGPKLIAMREHFADRALESRFLTEETTRQAIAAHIPIHLPPDFHLKAERLRNRLLAWRFHARHRVATEPSRAVPGVAARFNQTALALLSLIDDDATRAKVAELVAAESGKALAERMLSPEYRVLAALYEASREQANRPIPISRLAAVLSRNSLSSVEEIISPRSIGWVVRTKLRLPMVKSGGVFVIPALAAPAIAALAARYGIARREDDA